MMKANHNKLIIIIYLLFVGFNILKESLKGKANHNNNNEIEKMYEVGFNILKESLKGKANHSYWTLC